MHRMKGAIVSKAMWRVLVFVGAGCAVAAACYAAAVGGCETCIETAGGSCVPMKCHWTLRAVIPVELIAAFAMIALAAVRETAGRRWIAGLSALAQIAAFALLHTPLMGLCKDTAMACHAAATVCTVLGAVALALSVAAFVGANSSKADLPKRGI